MIYTDACLNGTNHGIPWFPRSSGGMIEIRQQRDTYIFRELFGSLNIITVYFAGYRETCTRLAACAVLPHILCCTGITPRHNE